MSATNPPTRVSRRLLAKALRKHGAVQLRQIRLADGRRVRPWALVNGDRWQHATAAEIRVELEKSEREHLARMRARAEAQEEKFEV